MSHLNIRLATLDDARDIWLWRNDPETQRVSGSNESIEWAAHLAWFESRWNHPSYQFYMGCLLLNRTVGLCRFDLNADGGSATVSINLNPLFRGQGYGRALLLKCLQAVSIQKPLTIEALIRHDNHSSLKCFMSVGFEKVSESEGFGRYVWSCNQALVDLGVLRGDQADD